MQECLAFQDLPIADDLFGAHGQSHEQRHDHAHEQICGHVQVLAENISSFEWIVDVVIANDKGENEGQQRGFQQVDYHVLLVTQLRKKIPCREQSRLLQTLRYAEG